MVRLAREVRFLYDRHDPYVGGTFSDSNPGPVAEEPVECQGEEQRRLSVIDRQINQPIVHGRASRARRDRRHGTRRDATPDAWADSTKA